MQLMRIVSQRCNDTSGRTGGRHAAHRPTWHALAQRFSDDRECLASYLAFQGAEVIGGVKPANLINLLNWQRPCGRNIYQLWRRYGAHLLAESGLTARELVQRDDGVLLLIYHPERLAAHLEVPKVANFLARAGYHQPGEIDTVLEQLQHRCNASGFPHEIGVVLGYPLKDVAGFMGWARLPVTGQGPWKIYGDPRPSLAVIEACRRCRASMARRLLNGGDPFDCLSRARQGRLL